MSAIHTIAHAKLNLFLHIVGQRADGYHNLQSVFTRIAFGDEMRFAYWQGEDYPLANNERIYLNSALTADVNDNLIVKASDALINHLRQDGQSVDLPKIAISINKRIATGAGLGGGSSNAASTLMALNQLWRLNLDKQTLLQIASLVGADVPFFVQDDTSAIVEGIGERMTPIALPKMSYLILTPSAHHSTAHFFGHSKLNKNSAPMTHDVIKNHFEHYTTQLVAPFYNAFEAIALANPQVCEAYDYLQTLAQHTKTTPRLTGTGSSVFLPILTSDVPNQKTIAHWIDQAPCFAVLTHSV